MKLTFTLIVLCFYCLLNAQKAGTLDSSFGNNGKVISTFQNYNTAESVLIEQDQKIIIAGECSSGGIVVRYNTDGNIDSSFGNNGVFITEELQGFKVTGALDKNEKIVLAGTYNNELRTIRLLNSGKIDSSFGKNGIASITVTNLEAENVGIQNDGKIVVVADDNYTIFTARWLSNGKPDSSYGTNALGILAIPESYNYATAIAITPENKIVIVGTNYVEYTAFLTARFLNNGLLDTSFNKTGYEISSTGNGTDGGFYPEGAYSCAIQPDGKVITAGTATLSYLHGIGFSLVRYNIDGSFDTTFGIGGILNLNVNGGVSACNAIVLQKDGKIIAAGAQNTNFLLTRFTSSGFTDTTFGDFNYTTTTDFGSDEAPHAIALQANGKIVLAGGASFYSSVSNILLARYDNNDASKKQIIIKKIKHYIQTHNDAQATTLNKVSLYPNPAQNSLHVEGLSANAKLTVIDFTGNIIVSRELSVVGNGYDLNVASLHAGNYLLKIETNGEVVTKQFLKE